MSEPDITRPEQGPPPIPFSFGPDTLSQEQEAPRQKVVGFWSFGHGGTGAFERPDRGTDPIDLAKSKVAF